MAERTRASRERPGGNAAGPATATGTAPVSSTPDRDALLAGDVGEIAASYGNQAGAAANGGPVADRVPSLLELAEIGGSFQLPGGRDLTDDWNQLSTAASGATVTISMSSTALRVSIWPPMVVDVQWPLSNVEWSGFTWDFRTGAISNVQVRNSQTLAFGAKSFVDSAVRDFVEQLVAGTPLARRGYDPLRDPNPQRTLQLLQANVGGGDAAPVGAQEVTNVTPFATVRTRADVVHGTEAGAIRIPAGTALRVAAGLAGTAADLQQGGISTIDWVSLSADGIELLQDGAPVARLHEITLRHGGLVDVGRFEPLGKVREYGEVETGLRGLFALLQIAALREGVNPGAIDTNPDARLVNGLAERQIEQALGDAVRTVIAEHHDAVPGVDLRQVLGVTAPAGTRPAGARAGGPSS